MVKYEISKLKYGSKIKYKNNLYQVDTVGAKVIKARKIFDINPKYNPYGSVANVLTSIPTKDVRK